MAFTRPTIKEFWNLVTEGIPPDTNWLPCWNYTGSDAYSGYKAFRTELAHRCAAVIYTGRIPAKVKQCCGNKHCVRLEHLRIASRVEETLSERAKKRDVPRHEQPDFIREVLAFRPPSGRYAITDLAKQSGTNYQTVRKILRVSVLYDLQAEVKALIESKRTVQRTLNLEYATSNRS